jgi:branched-chain amino acid transport system substrate-binding protein
MLNNIVYYEVYVPEPSLQFPGIEQFITRYRERAAKEGIEPLGFYLPPFAYAEMQILEAAITAAGSLDDAKIAEQLRTKTFPTVVGDLKFGQGGEWAEPRILSTQFQGITGSDVEQFKQPGKQVVLWPAKYKSGELKVPFEPIKR